MADVVLHRFTSRIILPRITEVVQQLPLFAGLSPEQVNRLAGICRVAGFAPGEVVFREAEGGDAMYLLLRGEAVITVAGSATPVGVVRAGEYLGEMALLTASPHSATATAETPLEAAVLEHGQLTALIRQRPDIGLHIYRNLAAGLGEKLRRMDASVAVRSTPGP